jgi:hypothetical protein
MNSRHVDVAYPLVTSFHQTHIHQWCNAIIESCSYSVSDWCQLVVLVVLQDYLVGNEKSTLW